MNKLEKTKIRIISLSALLCLILFCPVTNATSLFGYKAEKRNNLQMFPKWISVLERDLGKNVPRSHCVERSLDQCQIEKWLSYLDGLRKLEMKQQIERVNAYANKHKYVLDIMNYGVDDYWAVPGEFLLNNGDCEDYAIIKMLSLKILGIDAAKLKLVVLQDTNLRIPHAVLSVDVGNDILIMDNQIDEVISHKHILHYVPVYAVDDKQWWIYLPI